MVLYYCHGGGMSMGSSFFYLEFLLAWLTLLQNSGVAKNPALYTLEYTLVPDATYPTQVQETLAGYRYCLSLVPSPYQICVAGDSAGATLILSLLLCLSDYSPSSLRGKKPGFTVLISPWTNLLSPNNQNTPSDYLNDKSLDLYGRQYVGPTARATDPLVSPGNCEDLNWWRRASPSQGWYVTCGAEEVFAPDTRDLISRLRKAGTEVHAHEEQGWIHAWPVVKLFLGNGREERLGGLRGIVKATAGKMGNGEDRLIAKAE